MGAGDGLPFSWTQSASSYPLSTSYLAGIIRVATIGSMPIEWYSVSNVGPSDGELRYFYQAFFNIASAATSVVPTALYKLATPTRLMATALVTDAPGVTYTNSNRLSATYITTNNPAPTNPALCPPNNKSGSILFATYTTLDGQTSSTSMDMESASGNFVTSVPRFMLYSSGVDGGSPTHQDFEYPGFLKQPGVYYYATNGSGPFLAPTHGGAFHTNPYNINSKYWVRATGKWVVITWTNHNAPRFVDSKQQIQYAISNYYTSTQSWGNAATPTSDRGPAQPAYVDGEYVHWTV